MDDLNPQPALRADVVHVLQTYRAPWAHSDWPTIDGARVDPYPMYQRRAKTVFPPLARDFRWTARER